MTEIKLTKRYPQSRTEDIVDAYMRGWNDALDAVQNGKFIINDDRKTENSSEKPNNCEDEPQTDTHDIRTETHECVKDTHDKVETMSCQECKWWFTDSLKHGGYCQSLFYNHECRYEPEVDCSWK